jgi:hypothetical protein
VDTTGLGYFPKAGFCYRNVEKSGSANRDLVIKMTKRFSQCRCQHLRMWTNYKDFSPSRTLRHDRACFHVPSMDDRSERRIDGCTRDSCNSFLIACRRRKLNCLSLTFTLALSFAPSGVTHDVTIHLQV